MGPETKVNTSATGPVISVSELNRQVRQAIESACKGPLWVSGEISGLSFASSGHWYFSIKDQDCQVRCAMFRGRNARLDWRPKNGDAVEVLAYASLYEARGEFQLSVEDIRKSGLGDLFEAFQALKTKLQAEGLFEESRKRKLPSFPKRIAIITSPAAAALRDVVTTFARRSPQVNLRLYPSAVQGREAPSALVEALHRAEADGWAEIILLCRGGGSMEDLWAFNDEALARAIAQAKIPTVSGVGHETDFTIADFVADLRAPTPTAAAEQAAPHREELQDHLDRQKGALRRALALFLERGLQGLRALKQAHTHRMEHQLQERSQSLDRLKARLIHPREALLKKHAAIATLKLRLAAHHPERVWQKRRESLDNARARLAVCMKLSVQTSKHRLLALSQGLHHLNPSAVLARGYSLVFAPSGALMRDARQAQAEERLRIRFAQGEIEVTPTTH